MSHRAASSSAGGGGGAAAGGGGAPSSSPADLESILCGGDSDSSSLSPATLKFVRKLAPLTLKTVKSNLRRRAEWKVLGGDEKGVATLAEFDLWVKGRLVRKYGRVEGNGVWRDCRSCFGMAFDRARMVGSSGGGGAGGGSVAAGASVAVGGAVGYTDRYVSRAEFRLLCAYACVYASMLDAFRRLEGPSHRRKKGAEDDNPEQWQEDDDRRIAREEWFGNLPRVLPYPFASLSRIQGSGDPSSAAMDAFDIMDGEGIGSFHLNGWCDFLVRGEVDGGTVMGGLLSPGDRSMKRTKGDLERMSAMMKRQEQEQEQEQAQAQAQAQQSLSPLGGGGGSGERTPFSPPTPQSAAQTSSKKKKKWSSKVTMKSKKSRAKKEKNRNLSSALRVSCVVDASLSPWTTASGFRPGGGGGGGGGLVHSSVGRPGMGEFSSALSPLDVTEFTETFAPLAANTRKSRNLRSDAWEAADPNSNGLLSLSECDSWVKYALTRELGGDRGDRLWRVFRVCIGRAHRMARDVSPAGEVLTGGIVTNATTTTDDYVTKKEFRLFLAYLCLYAKMLNSFSAIDRGYRGRGGGRGDYAPEGGHDRRIELAEWLDRYPNVAGHGFVGLALMDVQSEDPESIFRDMDSDGKGMVLFSEWCSYLERREMEADTPMGRLLKEAEEEKRANHSKNMKKRSKGSKSKKGRGSMWGSLASSTRHKAHGGPTKELRRFVDTFSSLTSESATSQEERRREWSSVDANGNGLASLAEMDRWIHGRLVTKHGKKGGDELWRLYRPCFLRSFSSAKDVAPAKGVVTADTTSGGDTDDYITKREFRLFVVYLCAHAEMLDAFATLDGGSAGVDANDDRRIELSEWMEGYTKLVRYDFAALEDIFDSSSNSERAAAEAKFREIDADGGGMILLGEWCRFLEDAEIAEGTELGNELAKAANARRENAAKKKAAAAAGVHAGRTAEAEERGGPTEDLEVFVSTFADLGEDTPEGRELRESEWSIVDSNGNGLVSLAELDRWIKHTLIARCNSSSIDRKKKKEGGRKSKKGGGGEDKKKNEGERIWRLFRPCYMRSFVDARDIAPDVDVAGTMTATTDDYISKREFRLLIVYLCAHAKMLDAFATIDGGGAGVDANDDRRIELHEWSEGYRKMAPYGFAAFRDLSDSDVDPEGKFRDMDADGGGMVLLNEWCRYLESAEIAAQTDMGAAFKIAEEARRVKAVERPQGNPRTSPRKKPKLQEKTVPTEEYQTFASCFADLGEDTPSGREMREREWLCVDANGNGLVSLAEIDRWVKHALVSHCKSAQSGEGVWRLFRPCFMRSYSQARDVAPDEAVKGAISATTDDYISKREFRLLVVYLCAHTKMLDAFAAIDGGGAGVDSNDDRRIELREWLEGYERMGPYGFAAFREGVADPRTKFEEMDADNGGMVLLGEWCRYLESAEMEAGTEMGEAFNIAAEARKVKAAEIGRSIRAGDAPNATRVEEERGGPTEDLELFLSTFSSFGEDTPSGRELRESEWNHVDGNGNGLVSMAEFDRWIRHTLTSRHARGEQLWRLYRPCYIRSFADAKDVAPDEAIYGVMNATTDDYISKREFRLLVVYLCAHARMLDAFATIDGGGAGVDANDDRRIELHEWLGGYRKMEPYEFVAFNDTTDPEFKFKEIDADNGGMILLGEWCRYIEKAEMEAGTELGEAFAIAAEARKVKDMEQPRGAGLKRETHKPDERRSVPTSELDAFVSTFEPLGEDTPEGRSLREREWLCIDSNGNGLVSLAEIDRWVKQTLISGCKSAERGGEVWRLFRPCFLRSYSQARDVAPDEAVKGAISATTDDYISKREFRLLVVYLCAHARMLDAFATVDGGGAGVDSNDDRRIELSEWTDGYDKLGPYGFTAFADVSDGPESKFRDMDSDGGGMILFGEWCRYIEIAEMEAETEMGEAFAVAAEARRR